MQTNQWTVYNDTVFKDTLYSEKDTLCSLRDSIPEQTMVENEGMQGEPIPYQLYSDGNIISTLAIGFLLIVVAIQNENKSIWKIFKNCIITPGRSNLFDNNNNQTYILPTLLLTITTAVMCGLLTYHYHSYTSTEFFSTVFRPAIMGTYIGTFLMFIIAKWITYTIVDWIFFEKEKRKLWHKAFFNVISSMGIVLFAAAVYIVFLDSEFHISSVIILIIIVLSKILLFYNCLKYFFSKFHGALHLILYFCTLEIIPDLVLWKSVGLVNSILI